MTQPQDTAASAETASQDPAAPARQTSHLCLFCGSRTGHDPAHAVLAAELGARLAQEGIALVYGGGALGLMGIAARAALDAGGRVIGVIPAYLATVEIAQPGLTELVVVDTLQQRKQVMAARSNAFLALPGGIGTLDELLEMMTWSQLGEHAKPTWLLGPNGYWRPFQALLEHVVAEGFGDTRLLAEAVALPDLESLMAMLGRGSAPRSAAPGRRRD
ncbi:LOG family protein [Pedomonas mirosovicensis]|uniref:LOG family protein n=1 Tax=Pedomonas mirosovicensis TaxID=2908641 RepID=UPI002167A7AD|nr:TIGR00730 family Rossman fold protein [Pedomonas mirosovicensis]MCH8685133.1 TIGR00730 family Rossman fold protein [Pedomonas mirosovicensis]